MKYVLMCLVLLTLSCQRSIDLPSIIGEGQVENVAVYKNQFSNAFALAVENAPLKQDLVAQIIPLWDQATQHKVAENNVIVVPVPLQRKEYVNNTMQQDRYLALDEDSKTGVKNWTIVIIYSNEKLSDKQKAEILNSKDRSTLNSFTGRISLFNLGYQLLEFADYEQGNEIRSAIVTTETTMPHELSKLATQARSQKRGCIDWFLVTRMNGQVLSEVYITTTCDECNQKSLKPSTSARLLASCPGGYFSQGGGTPPADGPGKGPIGTYTDPCIFAKYMWNISRQNNRETFGVITTDGHFLITQILATNFGGNVDGVDRDYRDGQAIYYYNIPPGSNLPNIQGARYVVNEGRRYYAVPITAIVHTHPTNPGNDPAVLQFSSMSNDDIYQAQTFPELRKWVMNESYVIQFDENGRFGLNPCEALGR